MEALKKYGGVPSTTINSTSPSLLKHVGCEITIKPPEVNGGTKLTVNDCEEEQPIVSVTVAIYTPAVRPVIVDPVWPFALGDHVIV